METYIFANSPNSKDTAPTLTSLDQADLIIAADGGADLCLRLNITPDIVVGDLDSISPELIREYVDSGVEIIRHPKRKDKTDLELALDLAETKGAGRVVLFGVLGGRWDMSLSNIMLAASIKYSRMNISLCEKQCRMHIMHGNTSLILEGHPGQFFSLVPLSADVQGVTIRGFEYPLENDTLQFGSSRGLSNLLLTTKGGISTTTGILLVVQQLTHHSENNLPAA